MSSATGLGTFSKFPAEIRRMIWLNLMPECDGTNGNRPFTSQRPAHHNPRYIKSYLSLLRTSKILYREVSADLYHNRDLHVWIDVSYGNFGLVIDGLTKTSIASVPWRRFKQIVFFIQVEETGIRLRTLRCLQRTLDIHGTKESKSCTLTSTEAR